MTAARTATVPDHEPRSGAEEAVARVTGSRASTGSTRTRNAASRIRGSSGWRCSSASSCRTSARSSTCCSGAGVPRGRTRARARDQGDGGQTVEARPALPVCRSEVDSSYLVCPICTTKLKQGVLELQGAARGAVAGLPVSARRKSSRRRSRCPRSNPGVAGAPSSYSARRWPSSAPSS